MLIGDLALAVAALFTGAAIYVSLCEHPARLGLDNRAALQQWKPSYKRGAAMQGSLALLAALLGFIAWWRMDMWQWLAGALFILVPWPWTLFVIKPTNDVLLATDPTDAGPFTRDLLQRWGKLHLVRLSLGSLAMLLFLWAGVAGPVSAP